MNSSAYKFSYTSQLPLMFTLVDKGRTPRTNSNDLTRKQRSLWNKIAENRERVLESNLHRNADPAIQEYMLELWTWSHYWPGREFPGSAPEKIEVEDDVFSGDPDPPIFKLEAGPEHTMNKFSYAPSSLLSQHYLFNAEAKIGPSHDMFTHPSISPPNHFYTDENKPIYTPSSLLTKHHPFNTESVMERSHETFAHPSLSPPTRHYPTIQPTSEDSLRAECREAILQNKGADYIPYHGWDEKTGKYISMTALSRKTLPLLPQHSFKTPSNTFIAGLPPYSIICLASNGFHAFCGPQQSYFLAIKSHFQPIARIMYQRARTGLMIIWIEAPKANHVFEFRTNLRLWNEFKACWAFLKCWADAAGGGGADSVSDFLMGWRGEGVGEGVSLELPDVQVYSTFGRA
ncbi:hypothetical protein VTL71DRAFT_5386 [Oculimacula yallundae]|uniref:Uncharacterized protein n=1 Tax=Oculimacula yallundae TaxID=86028 RepID=A0ABR4C0X9_9HELO